MTSPYVPSPDQRPPWRTAGAPSSLPPLPPLIPAASPPPAPPGPPTPPMGSPPAPAPPDPPAPPGPPASSRPPSWGPALALVAVVALLVGGGLTLAARSWLSNGPGTSTSASPASPAAPSSTPSTASSGTRSSWAEVAAAVDPGVVNIETITPQGQGAGTGMVLSADGQILTNNHVVEDAVRIVVTVASTGDSYDATVVGTNPDEDVAVIQASGASGLTTIPLGDSDTAQVGDDVAAIGNAGGRGGEPAVATGTIVALDQQITASDQTGGNAETLTGMIQIQANVVPGDSGGPLADRSGRVIGMTTAASSSGGRFRTTTNEAFAIPINRAIAIASQLESGSGSSGSSGSSGAGSTSRGYLGVQVTSADGSGAEVVAVLSGSAAAQAGIEAGDVVVGVDGGPISSAADLTAALADRQPGDRVSITFERGDAMYQATVELRSR